MAVSPCQCCLQFVLQFSRDGDPLESMLGAAVPDELRLHERNVFCGPGRPEIDVDQIGKRTLTAGIGFRYVEFPTLPTQVHVEQSR